ncbi:MAG: hypothetical protein EOO43_07535 [Flavobacterium sp.]|nr:MAG: hypothetical protein EOO43_07535 [Flavobacterium sp.]
MNSQVPKGYYSGGSSGCVYGGDFCGGWFIASDSSFFFISSNSEGYINKLGKGKVIGFVDSTLTFEFKNDFYLPSRLNYKYSSDFRNEPDSIYLNLKFSRFDKQKLPESLMIYYGEKYIGIPDRNGIFQKTISKTGKNSFGTLYIAGRTGADPIQFFLNVSTNYHELIVNMSGEDVAYCRSIGLKYDDLRKDTVKLRVVPVKPKDRSGGIIPSQDREQQLLQQLERAKIKQKYLTPVLNDFIYLIKTK